MMFTPAPFLVGIALLHVLIVNDSLWLIFFRAKTQNQRRNERIVRKKGRSMQS